MVKEKYREGTKKQKVQGCRIFSIQEEENSVDANLDPPVDYESEKEDKVRGTAEI